MDQTQKCWIVKAGALPHKAWTRGNVWAKKVDRQLKRRYGPRYTSAMLGAALVGLFLPLPASTLLCVAVVVSIAEVHRAISRPWTEAPMHVPDSGGQPAMPAGTQLWNVKEGIRPSRLRPPETML